MSCRTRKAWRLLCGDGQDPNTVLALLPAGGLECERFAEIARDILGVAIGEEPGLRGMRTADNEPAPRDELDEIAEQVMAGP